MELMTKELEKRFAEIGEQSQETDPIIIAKYNRILSPFTYLMTEYFPEHETLLGYCIPRSIYLYEANGKESFSKVNLRLKDLQTLYERTPHDAIIRDVQFEECRFSQIMKTIFKNTYKALSDIEFELHETPQQRQDRYIERMEEMRLQRKHRNRDDALER